MLTKPKPRSLWAHRMLIEEIATRIRSAMEERDVSLFELAAKLKWSPARALQWIDGSLAELNIDADKDGSLGELVEIGAALGKQWTNFQIVKAPHA